MRQFPVEHSSPACASEQVLPQAPQLPSVVNVCSQPLGSWPSQSPHSESQLWIRQLPLEQVAVALFRLQGVLQEPQSVKVSREVSQPSASDELQSSHPESQAPISQAPPLHTPEAWL